MRILLFGDVVGRPGRQALAVKLPNLRKQYQADVVIANVENLAHGFGITPDTIQELRDAGVDLFTSGNHIWKNQKGLELMKTNPPDILRPANFPPHLPGRGYSATTVNTVPFLLINLQGEVFMDDEVSSPFQTFDRLAEQHGKDAVIVVDFHAEATGEKRALGWYIDGRAAVLVGTHTHIQTADEEILPHGTAYISDLGMVGAVDSSLGMDKNLVIQKVAHRKDVALEPPRNPAEVKVWGACVTIDDTTRCATAIERIDQTVPLSYTKNESSGL